MSVDDPHDSAVSNYTPVSTYANINGIASKPRSQKHLKEIEWLRKFRRFKLVAAWMNNRAFADVYIHISKGIYINMYVSIYSSGSVAHLSTEGF